MTEFLRSGKIRMINPHVCPHLILVPEHYRDDNTCKCDDPNERVMAEWGYKWDAQTKRWA
jgi:hypothetical protein